MTLDDRVCIQLDFEGYFDSVLNSENLKYSRVGVPNNILKSLNVVKVRSKA